MSEFEVNPVGTMKKLKELESENQKLKRELRRLGVEKYEE